MRIALVLGVIGSLLRLFSVAFLLPGFMAAVDGNFLEALDYLASAVIAAVAGTLMARGFRAGQVFTRSEAIAVVGGTWLVIGHFAAIPYILDGLSTFDAIFESISGFTTTGATILTDFDSHSRAFYLWRAMTQWFGGLGVIALFVVILPRLGIAGRQLFFAEASDASGEVISPQVRKAAIRLWILYVLLTGVQTSLLVWTGMTPYEGLVHSFTTLAAGGFSPNGESIAGYHNPGAEWVFVVFMILGGTSFTLQWRVFTGRPFAFFRDGEFLLYFGTFALGAVAVAIILTGGIPNLDDLRAGAFQCASLISSAGFASADYNEWADGARVILVLVMLMGGCAGSAAGGAKVVRHLLVLKFLRREITQTLHPRAVIPIRYGHREVPREILRAVFTLVGLYWLGYLTLAAYLTVFETDMVTAFSSSLACLGNIGPGFGPAGPMGNYAFYSDITKFVLTLSMWIGRLEIMTILALLHPHVWKNLRWRA